MGFLIILAFIFICIIYWLFGLIGRIFSAFFSMGGKTKEFDINKNNEDDEILTFDILDEDE